MDYDIGYGRLQPLKFEWVIVCAATVAQ